MLPLKISSFLERPPLPQAPVSPLRARQGAAESPAQAVAPAPGPPDHERRSIGNRRVTERRNNDLPAFLDTRVARGRRTNAGRRAEDQQGRTAISIKA